MFLISANKRFHSFIHVESEARGYKLLGARDACSREKVSFRLYLKTE